MDREKGVGIFVNLRLILRMRVEREKVTWMELGLESKSQSNVIFTDWIFRLSTDRDIEEDYLNGSVNGDCINRSHEDMEFLFSRWSIESHTFSVAWGEFYLTLKDAVALTGLFIFCEVKTIKFRGGWVG